MRIRPGEVGGERVALPVGLHFQLRRGDHIGRRRTARHAFGIGAVGARQIERRQQQERPGANAERGIRIGLGQDRQRPLRQLSQGKRVRRLQRRRRRGGGISRGDVGVVFRRRHRQNGAGPVGRRKRMHFRRRIVDRQFFRQRRQGRAGPRRCFLRIDLGRREPRWWRRLWRRGRIEGRHRRERRFGLLRDDGAGRGRLRWASSSCCAAG